MKIYLEEAEWKRLLKAALLDGILRYETKDADIPLDGIHLCYGQGTIEVTINTSRVLEGVSDG